MDRIDREQPLGAASAERLDRLFRLYNCRLVSFAQSQTRDADAAQDVVAETWLRAARRLHKLRNDDAEAFAWLRTIAQYAAVDHYRQYESPQDWTDAVASQELPAAASAEDVALTEPAEVDHDLAAALESLTEQDRTIVSLRLDGLTWDAIGQTFGRTCGAAQCRYRRALQTLAASPALAG